MLFREPEVSVSSLRPLLLASRFAPSRTPGGTAVKLSPFRVGVSLSVCSSVVTGPVFKSSTLRNRDRSCMKPPQSPPWPWSYPRRRWAFVYGRCWRRTFTGRELVRRMGTVRVRRTRFHLWPKLLGSGCQRYFSQRSVMWKKRAAGDLPEDEQVLKRQVL